MSSLTVMCDSGNGWPSKTDGAKSGGGRDNNPPKK